jgi:hypothetical protein
LLIKIPLQKKVSTAESVRWGFVRLHSQASGTPGIEPGLRRGRK